MNTGNIKLMVGNIIRSNIGNLYRVIGIDDQFVTVIQLETKKTNFLNMMTSQVVNDLREENLSLQMTEAPKIIQFDMLTEEQKKNFSNKKAIIEDFREHFGPYYEQCKKNGSIIDNLCEKYNVSRPIIWKTVREYYQSGCTDFSLIDQRINRANALSSDYNHSKHTGRAGIYHDYACTLTDEVRNQFDEGIKELLSGKRATSIKNAYDHLIQKYYTTYTTDNGAIIITEKPVEQMPTYKQFYIYFKSHTTQEQRDIIKTSAAEVRNNKRLLLSDTMHGVSGAGDMVEVDACEVDVSVVDTDNPEVTVGRPILYCMIDVRTRVILAISVAFENNSILGVTNLLMNLADDKHEYCRRYGITLTDSMFWPSNIIPRRIRFDRGAECTSKKLETVLNRLHIERQLVSAATGSLKGNVEQSFHQLHLSQNNSLEDYGLIEKRHDSKHHIEATLDIKQYTRIVINFVLSHNQMVIKGYPMSRELIAAGVHPVPIELWKYYISAFGSPRTISVAQNIQFRYDLMEEATAKISREGIWFVNHLYFCEDDHDLLTEMYDAGTTKKNFQIRFDPRNMNSIYYAKHGTLFAAHLNMNKELNAGFEDLTYEEMLKYNEMHNTLKQEAQFTSDAVRRTRMSINETIVKSAEKTVYSSTDGMRENRSVAKQKVRFSTSLMGEVSTEAPIDSSESNLSTINGSAEPRHGEMIPELSTEELNKMTDDELEDYMIKLGEEIQRP